MKSLRLQVRIDPCSGFCPGVESAVKKADLALDASGEIYCLGDILHNDEELERLKGEDLVFIGHEQLRRLKNKTVLFRSHGEPPSSYRLCQHPVMAAERRGQGIGMVVSPALNPEF
jgi:4-hydroxy-3-methylbut-2-en-1-yl diphosphate reductase